jgi:hypothetical protein
VDTEESKTAHEEVKSQADKNYIKAQALDEEILIKNSFSIINASYIR